MQAARRDRELRILAQSLVERDDVQHVQVLALVLVDALHLDVEERRGVDDDAGALADALRERFLVQPLDAAPFLLKRGVVGARFERLEPRQIRRPSRRPRCR